ncbi:protease modulator HflC [Microbulbifer thermotolerans]|uniref:Protein HflC n=1 Tax=Microbulbifer thermotolerans TaxID=252514 RepID=A0A143HI29_MICTH|nr:protease modulator HflC [Microbulbifer thermotolerans]AMX01374.1 protease modulator HflC [Microbulbifer thermotolerans]MCX2780320.1 protease modulator HflC [Microbulbifer thermotolerans]MCX2782783.1 protease modulator HflC [Microbulbifer thermotolerans]MCX2795538.1 protease modulator HflC [Microbulbifer thermotolerans]MCX2805337.1 protease modulator HflC [Microbulbifer thermotolerans]
MNNRTLLIIAALAIGLLVVSSSAFVVKETEKAVLLRFGEVIRTDYEPGLYFKVPLMHEVRKFDARIQTVDSSPVRMLNAENKFMMVDSYAKYRIFDVGRFYIATRGDERNAVRLLAEQINDRLRNQFGVRDLHEVVSGQRDELMAEITKNLNQKARGDLGVEIVDVRVKRIDLPPEVSESVFQRMRAGRELEARDHRAKGQEASERIRANADRQKVVIEAEAYRKAEELRGAGDAEAAAIYAAAYSKNPEFYRFTRSLQAYKESFKSRSDLLLVDPDSDFFRYLKDADGKQ